MTSVALLAGQRLSSVKPKPEVSDKDFLTDADQLSEAIIRRALKDRFPYISSFGEESETGVAFRGDGFYIDAIDGTVNYFHGDDYWGISIALALGGASVAGVVYLPAKGQMFFAQDDGPAWLATVADGKIGKPVPISVSKEDNGPTKPLILIDWVKEKNGGQDHARVVEILDRLRKEFLYPQIRNCSVANLMMVAAGKAAGFVHLRPEIYDVAAGCLIVERAGGKVTDLAGKPWSPHSAEKGIVASNGVLHDEILSTING